MYKEILNGYHDDSYVYIIAGTTGPYVSYAPSQDQTDVTCGVGDWDICSGLVKDIKRANTLEELQQLQEAMWEDKPKKKVFAKKPTVPKKK